MKQVVITREKLYKLFANFYYVAFGLLILSFFLPYFFTCNIPVFIFLSFKLFVYGGWEGVLLWVASFFYLRLKRGGSSILLLSVGSACFGINLVHMALIQDFFMINTEICAVQIGIGYYLACVVFAIFCFLTILLIKFKKILVHERT